jgi:hypothetical protein
VTVRAFLGIVVRTVNCATCHRNGTVTYWDPLKQEWIEGATSVPIHALAVLPRDEEARVRRHLLRHQGVAA